MRYLTALTSKYTLYNHDINLNDNKLYVLCVFVLQVQILYNIKQLYHLYTLRL